MGIREVMKRAFTVTFLAMLFVSGHAAQTASVSAEEKAAANTAYQKADWKTAAAAYEKIAKAEPTNAGILYRFGLSLINLGRHKEAQAPLESAMSISANSVFAAALARAYARSGESEKLFELLERAESLGGISAENFEVQADFEKYRTDARFNARVKKLDGIANPCRARPEYREFDFWIGEWAPQNAQGLTVGKSSVQLILSSCIIFENWETPVSAGKSFNLYDVRDGKWHQTWVDNRGLITHYKGGLVDGKMVLIAESVANGTKTLSKMTFTKLPDGNVRQHGESSTNDGKTWTTTFDFKYVKVK